MQTRTLSQKEAQLPADFVASQVDALFSDRRSFVIGSTGACVAMSIVAYRATSVAIALVAACFLVLASFRYLSMRAYARRKTEGFETTDFVRWEKFYHFGASVHIAVVSGFCLATFLTVGDTVDRMLSLATVLTYMAGIPGRNFANPAGVNAQILLGGLPLAVAIATAGPAYWLILGVVLVPFMVALRGLSARLRGIFVQATVKASGLRVMAARFDSALTNMSHGLAMFDHDGLLTVCNSRLLDLLDADPERNYLDRPSAEILAAVDEGRAASQIARLSRSILNPTSDAIEVEKADGRHLEFTCQPLEAGGAVVLVQDITERKAAETRINQLALYDDLTGLANRSNFKTQLANALARTSNGERYALLFIDLDQFKQVNDTLGHPCGDALLREVSQRIRAAMIGEVIGRFGGDEFVVLRRCGRGSTDSERAASDLVKVLSRPYEVEGHDVEIGASIGIALYPDHDIDADQLLKKADMALYAAKSEGRGLSKLFAVEMDAQAKAKIELEYDLHKAIRNQEFELFYQPIFDVKAGRFTVCEALLRWNHPRRGRVAPAEFVPIAEETGLIIEIGEWVLRKACAECVLWPRDMSVAVNISPLQFRRGDIVASVGAALAESGLSPKRLQLELTESVLLQDLAFTNLTMIRLASLRVGISLDDFGTGFSSLSYLHKLPLDKVKIDRSFLSGLGAEPKTALMIGGLSRLIRDLGMALVIEGVETQEQLRLLTDAADISEVQGYLFGYPAPAAEIRKQFDVIDRAPGALDRARGVPARVAFG